MACSVVIRARAEKFSSLRACLESRRPVRIGDTAATPSSNGTAEYGYFEALAVLARKPMNSSAAIRIWAINPSRVG